MDVEEEIAQKTRKSNPNSTYKKNENEYGFWWDQKKTKEMADQLPTNYIKEPKTGNQLKSQTKRGCMTGKKGGKTTFLNRFETPANDGKKPVKFKRNGNWRALGSNQRIRNLCLHMDRIQSQIDTARRDKYKDKKEQMYFKRLRYRLKKEKGKVERHIENLVRDQDVS